MGLGLYAAAATALFILSENIQAGVCSPTATKCLWPFKYLLF